MPCFNFIMLFKDSVDCVIADNYCSILNEWTNDLLVTSKEIVRVCMLVCSPTCEGLVCVQFCRYVKLFLLLVLM